MGIKYWVAVMSWVVLVITVGTTGITTFATAT